MVDRETTFHHVQQSRVNSQILWYHEAQSSHSREVESLVKFGAIFGRNNWQLLAIYTWIPMPSYVFPLPAIYRAMDLLSLLYKKIFECIEIEEMEEFIDW